MKNRFEIFFTFKYCCLLILFTASVLFAAAQPAKDTAIMKLAKHPQPDSIRVELLIDACVKTIFSADTIYLQWAKEAMALSDKINYRLGKIRALNCMGNYYYQRALHDKAIAYYIEALKMAEADGNENSIIIGKSNLANVYNRTKLSKDAILLFKECDAMLVKNNDTLSEKRAAILTNLSTTFSTLNQHDSSIHYTKMVLDICNKKDIKFGIALSLNNLGNEYYAMKKYDSSIVYLTAANKIAIDNHMDFLKGSIARSFGQSYIALGNNTKGIFYLNEALGISKQSNNSETLTDVYKQLYAVYAKTGDYKKAYEYSLLHFALKDSIYGIEKEKSITELSTRYETEKKEDLIEKLTQAQQITSLQSQRKSVLLYSIIVAIVLISFLAYSIFNRYKIKHQNKQLIQKIAHDKALNQSILTSIKAQMNPHFIFNALNTIQSYIYGNDKNKAAHYLGKFSELVRTILENSSKDNIPLLDELKFLTLYLELEKMRFEDSISITVNMEAIEGIADDMMIPSMIIQPYIENAFKHGLLHKKSDRQLLLHFDLKEDEKILICVIKDNGVGRTISDIYKNAGKNQHTSFATSATQKRLELLNEGRVNAISVRIEDKQSADGSAAGTKVIIEIPYTMAY